MELNYNECYGCRACYEICPFNCISMVENAEGFVYPIVDSSKCIECHLCEKTCPQNYSFNSWNFKQQAYVGKHESNDVCFNSSSGGAFTALYEIAIREKYVVYGVKWGLDFKVQHDRASNEDECKTFRKSKYILSDTNGCFQKISNDLTSGQKVLFSGSPCQCAALHMYLKAKKISDNNLIIVDIVCHGAPCQKVFNKYLNELQPYNKSIFEFRFKNKIEYCGQVNSRTAQVIFGDGKTIILDSKTDPFMKGYYGRLFYRVSCGSCKFARIERPSDITLGDAWHIEDIYSDLDSLSGVSLILSNSQKGEKFISEIFDVMHLRKVDVEWAHKANAQLNSPTIMHKNRNIFFKELDIAGFEKAVAIAMNVPFRNKVMTRMKSFAMRLFLGGGRGNIRFQVCLHKDCVLWNNGFCSVRRE